MKFDMGDVILSGILALMIGGSLKLMEECANSCFSP